VKHILKQVQAVIVSDYGYGSVTPGVRKMVSQAAQTGIPVIVDSRYNMLDFNSVTMLTPNEEELEMALNRKISDIDTLYEMACRVWEKTDIRALLVTRGSHGMALMTNKTQLLLIPCYGSDEIADVTGAGDTVAAAVALGLALGLDPAEAAKIANFSASIVVMKAGTAVVYPPELIKSVLNEPLCPDSRILKWVDSQDGC
jgi:rfaE bifunctional protein kinase chain/domain